MLLRVERGELRAGASVMRAFARDGSFDLRVQSFERRAMFRHLVSVRLLVNHVDFEVFDGLLAGDEFLQMKSRLFSSDAEMMTGAAHVVFTA